VVEAPQARQGGELVMTHSSPTLRELVSGISVDIQLLVAQTFALARLEASAAAWALTWCGVGVLASASIAVAGALVLVSALVLVLVAIGVPPWAAALAVGAVLTAGGAFSAHHFLVSMRRTEIGLRETRRSLRETLEWLKLQTGN